MYVSEVMSTKIVTMTSGDTVMDAARLMSEHNIGSIPVIEGEDVRGIITDRDIVLRCVAVGRDAKSTKASDVMTAGAICVSPMHTVDDVAHIMSSSQIRRMPVMDNGKLSGMVSLADVARLRHGLEAAEAICEISKP